METLNLRMFWWIENSIVTNMKVSEIFIGFITYFSGSCETLRIFYERFWNWFYSSVEIQETKLRFSDGRLRQCCQRSWTPIGILLLDTFLKSDLGATRCQGNWIFKINLFSCQISVLYIWLWWCRDKSGTLTHVVLSICTFVPQPHNFVCSVTRICCVCLATGRMLNAGILCLTSALSAVPCNCVDINISYTGFGRFIEWCHYLCASFNNRDFHVVLLVKVVVGLGVGGRG
jgi:hypothetical protein